MSDWCVPADALQKIQAPDAELCYLHHLELGRSPEDLLRQLIAETPWRQETVMVWGNLFPQPRLIAWYGDSGNVYAYSGVKLTPLPWTDLLLAIRERVEMVAGWSFNSVLLN